MGNDFLPIIFSIFGQFTYFFPWIPMGNGILPINFFYFWTVNIFFSWILMGNGILPIKFFYFWTAYTFFSVTLFFSLHILFLLGNGILPVYQIFLRHFFHGFSWDRTFFYYRCNLSSLQEQRVCHANSHSSLPKPFITQT